MDEIERLTDTHREADTLTNMNTQALEQIECKYFDWILRLMYVLIQCQKTTSRNVMPLHAAPLLPL